MFSPVIWVIQLCGLYAAVSVSDQCTAGCAQYSRVSKCLNISFRDFDLLCSPILTPLFQLLMIGFDESG
jgi:hypothetical protein